jgi:hypothetical protein
MAGSRYRELIDSLQYASLATRPDITNAMNKLAQFLANPGRAHLDAALRVLRYLKGTKHRSLHLRSGIPDIAGFQIRIGEAITTIASPPVHMDFVSDSEQSLGSPRSRHR